jgi:hypothetical protein
MTARRVSPMVGYNATMPERRSRLRIGQSAVDVLQTLVERNPSVAQLRFIRYAPMKGFRTRARGGSVVERAREATRHVHAPRRVWRIPAKELNADRLAAIKSGDARFAVSLRSRVSLRSGAHRHIVMLDFKTPHSPSSTRFLQLTLRSLGGRGVLLRSGASYHYYGFEVLTDADWRGFLHWALLIPGIDVRYVAHCLIEGMAHLRVTAGGSKRTAPRVVALV